jgi:hypothetical protein
MYVASSKRGRVEVCPGVGVALGGVDDSGKQATRATAIASNQVKRGTFNERSVLVVGFDAVA